MLISIIIPVYNKEKYLNDCIKSVVYQDYDNLEIIIINDGSQDSSELIIEKWVERDSRIKYFSQENKGVAFARNKGISVASGEYFFLLDADDMIHKNAISELTCFAEQSKADIIIGNFYEKAGKEITKKPSFKNKIYSEIDLDSIDTILEMFIVKGRHMARAGNKLYKTDFIRSNHISFMEGVIAEDRLFNLMCFVKNPTIQLVNKYTYIYNKVDNSRSRTLSSSFYDESLALLKYLYDYLKIESKINHNIELFELNLLYDVFKLINLTYEHGNQKITLTKSTINRLRENPMVINTVSKIVNQRKYNNLQAGKTFFRMRLINYLLIKAPSLILVYKAVGYLSRGIRYKFSKN